MTLAAPVVRQVARAVLHHAHPYAAELPGAAPGGAAFARMFGAFHLGPVGGAEGDSGHAHGSSSMKGPASINRMPARIFRVLGTQKWKPRMNLMIQRSDAGV